jgi:hypothetical protein
MENSSGITQVTMNLALDEMFEGEIIEHKETETYTAVITDDLGRSTRFIACNTDMPLDGKI